MSRHLIHEHVEENVRGTQDRQTTGFTIPDQRKAAMRTDRRCLVLQDFHCTDHDCQQKLRCLRPQTETHGSMAPQMIARPSIALARVQGIPLLDASGHQAFPNLWFCDRLATSRD
jgi:hypothetical protein